MSREPTDRQRKEISAASWFALAAPDAIGTRQSQPVNGEGLDSEGEASSLASKEIADWLLQEGDRQFKERQLLAALDKCQQALALYKEIGDSQGEARCLEKIVSAYAYLTGWT